MPPSSAVEGRASTVAASLSRACLLALAIALGLTLLDALAALRHHLGFSAQDAVRLLRVHGLAVLVCGLALELVGAAGRFVSSRSRWLTTHPHLAATLPGALLAAPGAWLLAQFLAGGEWIAAQPWVLWFRVGVVGCLVAGGAFVGWAASWRERGWVRLAGLFVALVLQLVDRSVLVGLYAPLHVALHVSSLVLAWLTFAGWRAPLERLQRRFGGGRLGHRALPLLAAGLVVLVFCSTALTPWATQASSLRLSPSLRTALARLMPPADRGLVLRVIRAQREAAQSAPTEGARLDVPKPRNVLVIAVDTLRADALPPARDAASPFRDEDTPFLNGWLASAYRFQTVYSAANVTRLSMPSTFESRLPFEIGQVDGVPLGERARAAGFSTYALVHGWFFGVNGARMNVLQGFDDIRTYARPTSRSFTRDTRDLLSRAKGKPFFAWLHYMGMHEPYDGRGSQDKLASPIERYRSALRELDRQLATIHAELRKQKLDRDTLVVLMSDHGELLGEQGRQFHGQTLLEAEMRVPLAFWIPGGQPRVVPGLTGNLDITPTIFDLLQQPIDDLRGRSLVPRMAGAAPDPNASYYVVSSTQKASGLITQAHTLIYEHDTGELALYGHDDLLQQRDLLGVDPLADVMVLDAFVEANPKSFARELADPATQAALVEALDRLRLQSDSRALGVLARFASISEAAAPREAALRAFQRAKSPAARRRLFGEMVPTQPAVWAKLGQTELERSQGADELEWLRALTQARTPLADEGWAVRRLEAIQDCRSPEARAWLGYLASSELTPRVLPPLSRHLDCALATRGSRRRETLLASLAPLARVRADEPRPDFESRLVELAKVKQHPTVMAATARALGVLGGAAAGELLHELVPKTTDGRVLVAALVAIGRLEGAASTPFLVELAEKRHETRTGVVTALIEVGDERALPTLKRWAQKSRGSNANHIAEAISAIERRARASAGTPAPQPRPLTVQ